MYYFVFVAVIASSVAGAIGLLREGLKQRPQPKSEQDSNASKPHYLATFEHKSATIKRPLVI